MIGHSPAFKAVERLIARVAAYSAPVLIQGETGTGKELAARAIHYASKRRDYPFVPVNCGALPDSLIENELFGHARGAFTDARVSHAGLVSLAAQGTLFLDEVDALSQRGQVVLLRFLQDQHFRPLGAGGEERHADVRVIAASNRCLLHEAANGAFRSDLLYRLRLFEVNLPPLRERREDIEPLAQRFIEAASAQFGVPVLAIHRETLAWFVQYDWPGNIRELEHLVYREFLLADGDSVRIEAPESLLRTSAHAGAFDAPVKYVVAKKQAMDIFETAFLTRVMKQAGGNIAAAARLSGTERRHLGRLLRKHRITKQLAPGA